MGCRPHHAYVPLLRFPSSTTILFAYTVRIVLASLRLFIEAHLHNCRRAEPKAGHVKEAATGNLNGTPGVAEQACQPGGCGGVVPGEAVSNCTAPTACEAGRMAAGAGIDLPHRPMEPQAPCHAHEAQSGHIPGDTPTAKRSCSPPVGKARRRACLHASPKRAEDAPTGNTDEMHTPAEGGAVRNVAAASSVPVAMTGGATPPDMPARGAQAPVDAGPCDVTMDPGSLEDATFREGDTEMELHCEGVSLNDHATFEKYAPPAGHRETARFCQTCRLSKRGAGAVLACPCRHVNTPRESVWAAGHTMHRCRCRGPRP